MELLLSYGADVNVANQVSHLCHVPAAPMISSTISFLGVVSSLHHYRYILNFVHVPTTTVLLTPCTAAS